MRFTNELGLPDAIVQACCNDDYTRGACDLSVTQLIAPPRVVELNRLHGPELVEDVADRIWLLMGKIAHGILEKAAPEHTAIFEERLFCDIDTGDTEASEDEPPGRPITMRISGAFDNLAIAQVKHNTWKLSDYKVTSVWAARHAANKHEWVQQLNCYAYLLRLHSFDVSEIEIVAICRDWRMTDARKYREDGYPQHQVAVLPLPLWPSRTTLAFMEERVALHRAARAKLPLCSDEERWRRATTWALMREGRKSAVRLYDTPGAAYEALKGTEEGKNRGGAYSVVKRPGIATRCAGYCSVRPFCEARDDGQFADGDVGDEDAAGGTQLDGGADGRRGRAAELPDGACDRGDRLDRVRGQVEGDEG